MAEPGRLGDEQVRELLVRLDELLERVEAVPGPTSEQALEAVETLAEVYGEALARVMTVAGAVPGLVAAFAGDELLSHLLILHGLHPDPIEDRVEQALDEVRPYIHSHGGEVTLAGIEEGVARVELSGSCDGCASSAATLEHAVSESVLAAAPELSAVEPVPTAGGHAGHGSHGGHGGHGPTLIPVESLLRRPTAAVGGRL